MSGSPAQVTVVLATYDRPETLQVAVRCVLRQSRDDWRLLVVGDHCAPATGELLRSFDDPRIRYLNLPARWGEQSGPNSIGIALAATPWIAFLNHDDLWLVDHLERAIDALEREAGGFHLSGCAFAFVAREEAGQRIPLFASRNEHQAPAERMVNPRVREFEPCSAWTLRTDVARAVGSWTSARALHRTSLHDWVLRHWRHGTRFVMSESVTCLKVTTQYHGHRRGEVTYGRASPEHRWLDRLLEERRPEALREWLDEQCRTHSHLGRNWFWGRKAFLLSPLDPLARWAMRTRGFDLHDFLADLLGRPRGRFSRRLLRLRTGQPAPPAVALDELLEHCRRELAAQP